MDRELKILATRNGFEDDSLATHAATLAYGGQLAKALEFNQHAVDSALRVEAKDRASDHHAIFALWEALVGNSAQAKRLARLALGFNNNPAASIRVGIALGLTGEASEATRIAEDLAKRNPQDTWIQSQSVPMIRAAVFLRGDQAAQAVEALALASRYELGDQGPSFRLIPVYLRGLAYVRLKQGPPAAAEFQKIIDHSGIVVNSFVGSAAHLGLGRALVLSGDNAKARTAYQDFLALWKDADPDLPMLQQAKSEYAKLQ